MSAIPQPAGDYYAPDMQALARVSRGAAPAGRADAEAILRSAGSPLPLEDLARLVRGLQDPARSADVMELVCEAGAAVRRRLFGNRVVPMAPVELANTCASDCQFCGWRISNRAMKRLRMPHDLAMLQVEYLVDLGIPYIEFVSGDDIGVVRDLLPGLVRDTRRLFARRGIRGKVSFCTLALTENQYAALREAGGDSMIVWQESYDPVTFRHHVTGGPKAFGIHDDWRVARDDGDGWRFRVESQERALRAGVEVALGSMLGLAPDLTSEFLATVDHARYLADTYGATPDRPVIIGMPIWNHITTRETDLRPRNAPSLVSIFPALAALYLLALPSPGTWVFPNCRVPLATQVEASRVAGAFTSTEVKLGPGGYLPAIVRKMAADGQDVRPLLNDVRQLLRATGHDVTELAHALDEREQFVHHYHAHAQYARAMTKAGLELTRDVVIPAPSESVPTV